MIDFIKVDIINSELVENLLKNPKLNFSSKVNNATAEIVKQYADYKNLKFEISKNKVTVSGSLHKYHNAGLHNYNDFYYWKLKQTIESLKYDFGINSNEAIIHVLEFGININIGVNPNDVLKKIICYKQNAIEKMKVKDSGANGVQSVLNQFVVKIYNKSAQYKPENKPDILRAEKKITRMQSVAKIGIKTISDLLDDAKLVQLKVLLIAMVEDCIFHENLNEAKLNQSQKKLYNDAGNPRFWEGLSKRMRAYYLSQYNNLIQQLSTEHLKQKIIKLVEAKWVELQANKTPEIKPSSYKFYIKKCNLFTDFSDRENIPKCNLFTRSIGLISYIATRETFSNIEKEKKVCKMTGISINSQKEKSVFLSAKTVSKMGFNNYQIQELNKRFRKNKEIVKDTPEKRVTHNVRNIDSNQRNNLRGKIIRNAPTLFSVMECVKLSEREKQILIDANKFWSGSKYELL